MATPKMKVWLILPSEDADLVSRFVERVDELFQIDKVSWSVEHVSNGLASIGFAKIS